MMVTHYAITRPISWGGTLTTTLCGRMNARSADGMNSSDDPAEVTCKFCRKNARFPAPAHGESEGGR